MPGDDGGREHKPGHAGGGGAGRDGGGQAPADPRQQQAMMLMRAARRYNEAHADLALEFSKLTGIDPKDFRAVRAWQLKHSQRGDGKIGPATVQAAKEEAGVQGVDGGEQGGGGGGETAGAQATASSPKPKKGHGGAGQHGAKTETVTFAEDEGSTVEGDPETSVGGEVFGNPNLMDNITGGAVRSEKRETKTTGERLEEAGGGIQDAGEGLHLMAGVEESPWFTAAMAPAIVQLLREGDYFGAIKALAESFSPSEYIEGLTMAAEKLGLHSAAFVIG